MSPKHSDGKSSQGLTTFHINMRSRQLSSFVFTKPISRFSPSNYLVANLCVASVFFMGGFCFYNMRSGASIQLLEYSPLVCSVIGVLQSKPSYFDKDLFKYVLSGIDCVLCSPTQDGPRHFCRTQLQRLVLTEVKLQGIHWTTQQTEIFSFKL